MLMRFFQSFSRTNLGFEFGAMGINLPSTMLTLKTTSLSSAQT
jgi:hypothetical protein